MYATGHSTLGLVQSAPLPDDPTAVFPLLSGPMTAGGFQHGYYPERTDEETG